MAAYKYKYDFNKYKTDISLPDFLLKFGWKFTVGSSTSAPKMTNGTNTIVIKRNSSNQFTYWDVHNESLRGLTIIDFMKQHIINETGKIPTLKDIGIILENYIKNNEVVLPENSIYKITNSNLDENAIIHLINQLQPYKGDFLQTRGINIDILKSETFKDVFFTRSYKKDDYIFRNTCIKMINPKGIQGISQRNEQFKGILGNHYESIAVSQYDKNNPIDIYIGESMIDCASHYEINFFNPNNSLNLLYISSEGTLTDGQIQLIKLIHAKNQVNKTVSIFDNDKKGYIFSLNLISQLRNISVPDIHTKKVEEIKKLITELTNDHFQIHLSKQKDWNDDLKQSKGLLT